MKNKNKKLNDLFIEQKKYSNLFYDLKKIDEKQKLEILKSLCLSLTGTVSQISNSVDYKNIKKNNIKFDEENLIYHTVDSLRYIFEILNLYNVSIDEFEQCFVEENTALNIEAKLKDPDEDDKVIIVDIDDVLCEFRNHFNNWLEKYFNIKIDKNSDSYYTTKELIEISVNPEHAFELFIKDNQMLKINVINESKHILKKLKDQGYYIYLLTSRPKNNLRCKYQTFKWLEDNNVIFDNIDFTPEKYLWLTKQKFYLKNQVKFIIDDSPKHALEYATHGTKCFVPIQNYNANLKHCLISHFKFEDYDNVF